MHSNESHQKYMNLEYQNGPVHVHSILSTPSRTDDKWSVNELLKGEINGLCLHFFQIKQKIISLNTPLQREAA